MVLYEKDFLKNFYDKTEIKRAKSFIYILNNKNHYYHPDFYLPKLNLAFEYNGIRYHNELYKTKNYHKDKTDKCKEKGIQLIHIWELLHSGK